MDGSKYIVVPNPSQLGHAPNGLLNEKSRGSISSIVKPDTGQAKRAEKIVRSALSAFSAIASPSANSRAVSIESAKRVSKPGLTTTRSTTISISCFLFLSSLGASSIS